MQEEVTEKITEVVKEDVWGSIKEFLNWGVQYGEGEDKVNITIGLLILVIITFIVTSYILVGVRKLYTRKMSESDTLKFKSIFKFIKYIAYVIVVFAVLSVAGVNVTPFLAASAALLVGVGLALQELFQDIIGGIFIIVDKSLLVGDVIEVNGKVGRVIEIKLRTTRAITRDDKIFIIPNHKFLSETIYNYTQNHKQTREFVKVGVAYGSDTQLVKNLMLKSVQNDKRILKRPAPFVLFEDFGDSALIFSIYFFINDSFIDPGIKSDIRFRIDSMFRENKISIPFPQRDVHLFTNDPNLLKMKDDKINNNNDS